MILIHGGQAGVDRGAHEAITKGILCRGGQKMGDIGVVTT